MSIDYTGLANTVDGLLKSFGVKFTLTQQPEGTTSSAFGIMIDTPDENIANTTTLYKTCEIILSPKLKAQPKPGDWLVRGNTDDRFVVQSVETLAPAGKGVFFKLKVAI